MILFRWLLPLLAAAIFAVPGHAAVEGVWSVNLLRSGTTQSPASTGATQEAAWAACLARIPTTLPARTLYKCQTPVYTATVTPDPAPPPPPVPVDCAVSDWSAWSTPAWGQCSNGTQSRVEVRTRTVTTPASNGGAACPALTESRVATQACISPPVDPPPPPPPPTAGNYLWYPALDVGSLPFAQAGAWGAAMPLQIAAAPVTTRTVNAATPQQVRDASWTPGTRIVLTASMGSIGIGGPGVALTDLEIVIPAGISVGKVNIGGNINRVRIGGPVRGTRSGGYVAGLDLNGAGASNVNDIVVDGLDIGSTLEPFGYSIINSDTFTRFAITNNRLRSVAASTLLQGRHIVIAGNSIESSAYTWGQLGAQGTGWSLRLGSAGPVVVVGNDIRGRRYHRFRLGTGDTNQSELLIYVARNTFLDESESSIAGVGILTGNTPARAAWFVDNDVYAYGGGARLDVSRSLYGRVTGNRIYSSSITAGFLAGQASAHLSFLPNADVDYSTGNTFAPWRRPAAWGGAGDATQVPLPPAPVINQALEDQERAIPRGP